MKNLRTVVCAFLVMAGAAVVAAAGGGTAASKETTNGLVSGVVVDGDRISVSVENVEITQILRMLSVRRRVSIVAGPEVTGSISLNLYDVTFEEALRAILDVSGYSATHKGDVILIMKTSGMGELPIDASDLEVRVFKLNYADVEQMGSIVDEFVSPAGKSVVNISDSTLLVVDMPDYLERIASLVQQMDVPPRQVLIEVGMFQVTYSDDFTFGVGMAGKDVHGETESNPSGNTVLGALTTGFASDFTLLGPGAEGLFGGVISEDAQVFIEALAGRVDIKTLANPKILALHNQPATIMIGDRLGYKVTTTQDGATIESVEFIDVGTQLVVTPHIADDGLILLEINPQVSSGNISTTGLPSESTAEASTSMLVEDGQTIVLGGLISDTETDRVIKVPLLGDIPILGYLFKRTTKSSNKSELVVLITPRIVGPRADEAMRTTISSVEAQMPKHEGMFAERERGFEPDDSE